MKTLPALLTRSFYPKPYVDFEFGLSLQKNFQPGTYAMVVQVKDACPTTFKTSFFRRTQSLLDFPRW